MNQPIPSQNRIWTVPNLLSFLRIILAAVFCFLFDPGKPLNENWPSFVVLAASALSDALDGKLARALHQVTELGKILDPIADYLTKFALILCFVRKYPGLLGLMLIFLIRVFIVAYAGWRTIKIVGENGGAILAGKADTAVFYAVMLALVVFRTMPAALAYVLIGISAGMMVLAVLFYLRHFHRLAEAHQKAS